MVKPTQEGEFFCKFMKYFLQGTCSFPYILKALLKISDPAFEQNPQPIDQLKRRIV